MKRFLVLAFALLFVAATQVAPQADLMDGDAGFSYAILSNSHFHPPLSTRLAHLTGRSFTSCGEPAIQGLCGPETQTAFIRSSPLATVLRC